MDIEFEERGNNVLFQIINYDLKYEPILKMCYYEKVGNTYLKSFSKDIKNIERIKDNFKKNAGTMFDQLGYFTEVPWEEAIYEFVKKIAGTNINWWLTGSCAACIRGIPFKPHDLDIMVDSKDIEKIKKLFSEWIVEPIIDTNGWLTKDFGVLFKHARIDIASDPSSCLDNPEPVDCGAYAKEHLEEVTFKGYTIKVPPIKLQINANRRRNRMERVKLLEKYLNNNLCINR